MVSTELHCPSCNCKLTGELPVAGAARATDYESCHRRCDTCQVGASNGRNSFTFIYKDPLQNIPAEVRIGALETLSNSLNKRNILSKISKFGYDTSEDAITWTMFSYMEEKKILGLLVRSLALLPEPPLSEPTLLLWGAPVGSSSGAVSTIRDRIKAVLINLGENSNSFSEPDVVLDFGTAGIVVIEVKFRCLNSTEKDESKFERYLSGSTAFRDSGVVLRSGLYELARNWRLMNDLASDRPGAFVNLVNSYKREDQRRISLFSEGIASGPDRLFHRLLWDELVRHVPRTDQWLLKFLQSRELLPSASSHHR